MKKILIVDDEQDIVESLKFVLESSDTAATRLLTEKTA